MQGKHDEIIKVLKVSIAGSLRLYPDYMNDVISFLKRYVGKLSYRELDDIIDFVTQLMKQGENPSKERIREFNEFISILQSAYKNRQLRFSEILN